MTTLNISSSHHFLRGIETNLKFYGNLNRIFKFTLGALGLVAISPINVSIRGISLYKIKKANKQLDTAIEALYSDINNMSPNDKIDAHLRIERLNREIIPVVDYLIGSVEHFRKKSLTKWFYNSILQNMELFKDRSIRMEITLKEAAYPHVQRAGLSPDQIQELSDSYKTTNIDFSDWEGDELDIYEAHYKL